MNDGYHYALAFRRADGSSAGQVPVTVDWEPACESTRFGAVRHGGRAPRSSEDPRVDPLWDNTMGEPYVGGVRVSIEPRGEAVVASEFTTAYFGDLVQPAVRQLVDQKHVQPGETLTYRVVAFPCPQRDEVAPVFASEEYVSPPVCRQTALAPFLRESLALALSEAVQDDFFVFLRPTVARETRALAEQAGPVETGGVLVGHLHQDIGTGGLFVEVTAQIPTRGEGSSTSLTFTAQTWTDVRAALDLRRRDELMLGWWHSHPVKEWCKSCPVARQQVCGFRQGFLSAEDRLLHRTVFPRAYSLALVLSDVADLGITYRAFGWRHGILQPRGFHLLNPTDAPPVIQSAAVVDTEGASVRPVSESACEREAKKC